MQLLSLTLDGFKSFAQKTTIKFEPGMTGIIGPNGSGKSNIIEAIRWVMGEQSARHLRGDKMADVIFNGAADRQPLNRALVSITLDNSDHYLASDFRELTITRKLYRNGDSEYLINGQKVRLKDITDLFIDSGLGRESFSIISQGRVAAVFNGKPVDRRGIIETVAGVAKYKKNKETAEKRLTATMDNLNRVNDIISELSRQLEPLADESALAKDYLEQKKQFDLLDRTQTVRRYDRERDHFATVQAKYRQTAKLVADYQAQQTKVDAMLTKLKQRRAALLKQKDAAQQEILAQTEKIAQLKNEQSMFSMKRDQQLADQRRLNDQADQLTAQLKDAEQAQQAAEEQLAAHQQEIDQHQADYDAAQRMSSAERIQALNKQLGDLRNQQINLMQELTTVHNQQAFLKRSHEQRVSQQNQNSSELQDKQAQLTKLKDAQQGQRQENDRLNQQVTQFQDQVTSLNRQLTTISQQYQQAQRDWYAALGDVHSTKARIKNYRAMSEEYAGYYQGVRTVLQNRQNFPGLAGPVSELFDVPAKLTTAIETVLGGQLQQLVVDQQSTGKRIISYLVQHRGGRATILPLDTLIQRRPAGSWNHVATLPGVVGRAVDLIQFDPQFQVVADYLLGNTVVADNLDHATAISRAGHHQLRVVTLDGQLINASGAMTGGANRHRQHGLLTQKQLGKQLADLLDQQEDQVSQTEQRVAELKAQHDKLDQQLATLQEQLHTAQLDQHTAQSQLTILADRLQDLDRQIQALQSQAAQQGSQVKSDQDQVAQLKAKENKVIQQQQVTKQGIDKLTAQIHDLETNASAQNEELHQMEQWLAVAAERKQQFQHQLAAARQTVTDTQAALTRVKDQLTVLAAAMNDDHSATAAQQTALQDAQKQLSKSKHQVEEADQQLTSLDDDLAIQEDQHQRTAALQQAASDDAGDLKAQQARSESRLDQLLNHLNEQYQLTIDAARQNISDLDDDQLARQLKLLRRGLAELGDVNVGSIAEYDRVKKHYDFLKGQQDDLLAARKQLNQTMGEMDSQVEQRFTRTFKQVSAAFDATFKQIFGGGQAKLILTDPDHLLTTGIDIMAQPPGKKNQHLSLLSGGERALTAITLLFAILKVRPVPFAILDEPEAALDEVNVQRFAQYLNRFGKTGPQFIVITHRKGTMMGADVLYGVTMQESGVSRMVSVDVIDTMNEKENQKKV
ncbi:MAG: chromosome segregation protein SMC [Limosilactobacillus pontis]|uniref:Chromosome partition protein Smc n=1 Tax=Limosilactobacillus pontis TaxID=35787 RepID=A0A2J6NQ06_9LACO|nr:chromosome segregation protein SMC [Limosilactobacillus pontis]PMB83402.1 chromosome segregation protein SMC [Limosilactobacillus pontis]